MKTLNLIQLENTPIFEQLQLEEALLRSSEGNYLLINRGSPPAIVLGISGKVPQLVDIEKAAEKEVKLIRRFSGGGTVVVGSDTLFVTFLFNANDHSFEPFPNPIAKWTESIYQKAFSHIPFELKENDYCLGDKKIGGNAQYLRKNRWLHHTTFLWDYDPEHMKLLLHPSKTPSYRAGRSHEDFITKLSPHFSSTEEMVQRLLAELEKEYHLVESKDHGQFLSRDHRKSTTIVDPNFH